MKLWTKSIENKAKKFPLYSQDGKGQEAEIIVKYFNPYGSGTGLITEAEKQDDGDWLLYGYMHITEWEWGYIMLSEIENTRIGVFKMPLERDLYIGDHAKVKEYAR